MGWFDDNPPLMTPEQAAGMSNRGPVNPILNPGYQAPAGSYPRPSEGGGLYDPRDMAGGVTRQDPRAYFQSLFPGSTLTPQQLASKEAELKAAGIRLLGPNAAGMRTKIELPGGEVIDVIGGAGAGHNRLQWLSQGMKGSGPTLGTLGGAMGGMNPQGGGVNYLARQGALNDTPGYKFVMGEAMDALERSAAAKGTLLTGGHMKELQDRAAGLASMEFGNEFGRNLSLASLGLNAAGAQGAYGTSFGNQITDLTTGAGNASAAGTAAGGQAWSNYLGGLGNTAGQLGIYNWMRPPTPAATGL